MLSAARGDRLRVRRNRVVITDIPSILYDKLKVLEVNYLRFWNDRAQEEFTAVLFSHKGLTKVVVWSGDALPPKFKFYRFAYTRYGLFLSEIELRLKFVSRLSISLLAGALKFNQCLTRLALKIEIGEQDDQRKLDFLTVIQNGTHMDTLEISSNSCLSSADFWASASLLRTSNKLLRFHCGILDLSAEQVVEERLMFAAIERRKSLERLDDRSVAILFFGCATRLRKQIYHGVFVYWPRLRPE